MGISLICCGLSLTPKPESQAWPLLSHLHSPLPSAFYQYLMTGFRMLLVASPSGAPSHVAMMEQRSQQELTSQVTSFLRPRWPVIGWAAVARARGVW